MPLRSYVRQTGLDLVCNEVVGCEASFHTLSAVIYMHLTNDVQTSPSPKIFSLELAFLVRLIINTLPNVSIMHMGTSTANLQRLFREENYRKTVFFLPIKTSG